MKSVQDTTSAWTGSSGRAQANFQKGVEGFTGDWAGATTRQQAVMLANLNDAINSGRWSQGIQATGTNGWKSATVAKVGNYGTGFAAGANRYAAAAAKFMPAIANGVSGLSPRGDIYANLDRSRALALYLHGLKGSLGAR